MNDIITNCKTLNQIIKTNPNNNQITSLKPSDQNRIQKILTNVHLNQTIPNLIQTYLNQLNQQNELPNWKLIKLCKQKLITKPQFEQIAIKKYQDTNPSLQPEVLKLYLDHQLLSKTLIKKFAAQNLITNDICNQLLNQINPPKPTNKATSKPNPDDNFKFNSFEIICFRIGAIAGIIAIVSSLIYNHYNH